MFAGMHLPIIKIEVCILTLTDCLYEDEQYKDDVKMKRLLQCRQDEVASVYHEKELLDIFLTMSQTLGEHIAGMVILQEHDLVQLMQGCKHVFISFNLRHS